MKKKNIIKNIAICGSMTCIAFLTSCNDWLTLYPSTQIVEENFWEDKNDLESVRAAAYRNMLTSDNMEKLLLWGEARSDNFIQNPSGDASKKVEMKDLMNANLEPKSPYFSWSGFYTTINFCTKVLEHGEDVVKRDESFTMGDWEPIKAEMVALRALNYFYLVRSFKDVPLVLKAINDDSQVKPVAQSTQQAVLDTLINQLESVKDIAMEDYGITSMNKGRFNKKSIRALLADLYLWRAAKNESPDSVAIYGDLSKKDYLKCIEHCDYIIEKMKEEDRKNSSSSGGFFGDEDKKGEEFPLIQNSSEGTVRTIGAYYKLFGNGQNSNSKECIFSLQFQSSDNNSNNMLHTYYSAAGDGFGGGLLVGSPLLEKVSTEVNAKDALFFKTDLRRWESVYYNESSASVQQTMYQVTKYVASMCEQSGAKDNTPSTTHEIVYLFRDAGQLYTNWIVYRLSEIMLMKAEALSRLYSDEENLKQSFKLVREVYKRSNPYPYNPATQTADTLNFGKYNSQAEMEKLIMSERQREFFAEGKRWFDLVRFAQRRGSTQEMLDLLARKYPSTSSAIKAKLSSMDALFSPISEAELKVNKLLKQNPVWDKETSISKN